MPTREPPVALRRAVSMGYNTPEEIKIIRQGQATPANQVVPPTVSAPLKRSMPRLAILCSAVVSFEGRSEGGRCTWLTR